MQRLAALLLALALASCAGQPTQQPSFYRDLTQSGEKLDEAAAASMISDYRTKNVKAQAMAKRDKLDRGGKKPFVQRLRKAGYLAKLAAENVGAGYHTLAQAFSGWRDSKPHNANMLLAGATRIGIAAVYTPASKYKVYWTLILAEPEEKKG